MYPYPYGSLPPGVALVQANLADCNLMRRTLEDRAVEVVYHAAWTTIHETSLQDPAGDIRANLEPTVRLLDACRDAGVRRIVYLSSGGTVYGVPQSIPVSEEHPTNPITAYGVEKLAGEKYLHMYAHLYGLEYVILRPSVPFGPRQNPHRRQGAVTVFVYRALHNRPVTIWGDGEIVRDYFYIEDLSQALLMAGSCSVELPSNPVFNIGGERAYSLNELVYEIERTLGVTIDVEYQPARCFDVPHLHLDCRKASEQLGWCPTISLSEGIRRTAEWLSKWEPRVTDV